MKPLLDVPSHLRVIPDRGDERSLARWELELIGFISPHYRLFTPFPQYFRMRGLNFQIARQLLRNVFSQRFDTILEVGCGVGFHTLLLSPHARRLVGIDIPGEYSGYTVEGFDSSPAVARALVNECFGVESAEFHEAFPDKVDLPAESVDLVFSWTVLEHVPDLKAMFSEMARIVRPGGLMVHVVPTLLSGIDTLLHANIEDNKKKSLWGLLKRLPFRAPWTIPGCHSEFLTDYGDQLRLYVSDTYLFPMLEAGFAVQEIVWLRDFNNAVVMKKL